jgi:hypothetical protein
MRLVRKNLGDFGVSPPVREMRTPAFNYDSRQAGMTSKEVTSNKKGASSGAPFLLPVYITIRY